MSLGGGAGRWALRAHVCEAIQVSEGACSGHSCALGTAGVCCTGPRSNRHSLMSFADAACHALRTGTAHAPPP